MLDALTIEASGITHKSYIFSHQKAIVSKLYYLNHPTIDSSTASRSDKHYQTEKNKTKMSHVIRKQRGEGNQQATIAEQKQDTKKEGRKKGRQGQTTYYRWVGTPKPKPGQYIATGKT